MIKSWFIKNFICNGYLLSCKCSLCKEREEREVTCLKASLLK